MQPGSFYCFVPKKGAVSSWLPFCKQTQRGLYRKLNALLKQGSLVTDGSGEENELLDDSDLYHCTHYDKKTLTQSFVLPGAGVCIRQGSIQLTKHLTRKEPNVYSTEKALIVFYGYISNVEEVCMRLGRCGPYSTNRFIPQNEDMEGNMELTMGDITARLLLHLYLSDKAKDPLLVLTELQGHYAFVIYDSDDKNVFAARDASGREPLYYTVEQEKGGVTITNKPGYLPDLEEEDKSPLWKEIPPGYYMFGRNPQLQQYALTPHELTCRWSMDLDSEVDLHFSLESSVDSRRSWSASLKDSFLGGHTPTSLQESEFYPQTL